MATHPLNFGYNAGMNRESVLQWAIYALFAAAMGTWVNRANPNIPIAVVFCGVMVLGALADKYLKGFTNP